MSPRRAGFADLRGPQEPLEALRIEGTRALYVACRPSRTADPRCIGHPACGAGAASRGAVLVSVAAADARAEIRAALQGMGFRELRSFVALA